LHQPKGACERPQRWSEEGNEQARACGERIEALDGLDEVGQDASKIRTHNTLFPQLADGAL
jgi:hypothetical protein